MSYKYLLDCFHKPLFLLCLLILFVGLLWYIKRTKRPPKTKCLIFTLFIVLFYLYEPVHSWHAILIAVLISSLIFLYNIRYKCKKTLIPGAFAFLLICLVLVLPRRNCYVVLFLALAAYIGLAWYDEFGVCEERLYPTGSFISRIQAPFKPQYYKDQAKLIE